MRFSDNQSGPSGCPTTSKTEWGFEVRKVTPTMIFEIIKRIKEARDLETNKDFKAGLQKALVIVLEIDRENDQAKLQELHDKFNPKKS